MSFLVAEVALRAFGVRPTMLDKRMFRQNADSLLPFTLQPGFKGPYAGGYVTIDRAGNRTVKPRRTPPPGAAKNGVRTLLLLGDSQIFGQGLDDDQTTASQLQDSLWSRGLPILVANIGVPGYTSWNEYAAFRDFVAAHSVDWVVLSYIPNDPTFNNDFFGISRGQFSNISDSPFHRFTQAVYRRSYTAYLIGDAWRRFRSKGGQQVVPLVPSDSAVEYSIEALDRIKKLCEMRGANFSVGLYRDVSAFTSPKLTSEYENKIQKAFAAHHIEWFPLQSHIAHLTRREAMVSWSDPHPSARATSFIVSDILGYMLPKMREPTR